MGFVYRRVSFENVAVNLLRQIRLGGEDVRGKTIAYVTKGTALAAAGIFLLGGCGVLGREEYVPREADAVSIQEDGTVTERVSEELDESYYDETELEGMIASEVSEYNRENGEDSVAVTKMEIQDGKADLTLTFASGEDFASFNNVEFYYGSIINAQLAGYLFDTEFKQVRDGVVVGGTVSGSKALRDMSAQVLIVEAPMEVEVPGTILYTSVNSEVLSERVVNATGESEEDEEEDLILPSNAVYQKSEGSFEEEAAKKRVYIIFEQK